MGYLNMLILIKRQYVRAVILLLLAILLFFAIGSRQETLEDTTAEGDNPIYLPIIMYHEIKTFKLGKDVISPYEFESDLKYLQANNYNTITLTQLIEYVYSDGTLPVNPIILTFDDGYLNNYKYALPLIKKYNMKIVLSIIGKNTDDFTRIPDNNIDYSHLTWDQLNEMIASGLVEVQNHTYNLHNYGKGRKGCLQCSNESFEEYEQVLIKDIGKLQSEIFSYTGNLPNTFTYPFGKSSENTEIVIRKLGFQATLSCDYGINLITKDPETLFGLKRICRSHGDTMENIIIKAQK